jgi:hypothetical protein
MKLKNFHINPRLDEDLRRYCKKVGATQAGTIRRALQYYLRDWEHGRFN